MTLTRNNKRVALVAGLTSIIAALGLVAVVFGGVVNVAATERHWDITERMLRTTMKSSVRAAASDITPPPGIDLRDPALAERAFGHYSVACTTCHGGPGIDPAPWMVTNPPSPLLVETADEWSDAELYWIVKHGIKMTGMPALGPTHEDADLWAIAAFVRQLPTMTPEAYAAMAQAHEQMHRDGHTHEHGM